MAITAASNGTTVDEKVVFSKGKYYFSLTNGGIAACDESAANGKTATSLANGVKVYFVGTSATLNETWARDNGGIDVVCIAYKGSATTLNVYDEDGNLFYTEKISTTPNNGVYFWMYNENADAKGAGKWTNRPTIQEAATGYYYFTIGTLSGIFYYGA